MSENKCKCKIIEKVEQELLAQEQEWGKEHDREHSPYDWIALIIRHLGKAIPSRFYSVELFQQQMIRVAALCISSIRAIEPL